MDGEQLVTKAQMIEDARHAGFGGELRILAKTFTNYQQVGLLGHCAEKAKRRGGEGLWHPAQHALWLSLLHSRRNGLSIARCTALPVSLWLLGCEGIPLAQAQKAWDTWSKACLDFGSQTDRRAKARREVDGVVSRVASLAGDHASTGQRHALRDSLDHFLDGLDVTRDTYMAALLAVSVPEGQPTLRQRAVAANAHEALLLHSLAVSRRDVLVRSTPDVAAFWEWARGVYTNSLKVAVDHWPELAACPDVGPWFELPTSPEVMLAACADLATTFGVGIAHQLRGRPLGVAPEPPLVKAFREGRHG